MEHDKLRAARKLIQLKRYAEARYVLRSLPDDATAKRWLTKLDEIDPATDIMIPPSRVIDTKTSRQNIRLRELVWACLVGSVLGIIAGSILGLTIVKPIALANRSAFHASVASTPVAPAPTLEAMGVWASGTSASKNFARFTTLVLKLQNDAYTEPGSAIVNVKRVVAHDQRYRSRCSVSTVLAYDLSVMVAAKR